MMAKQKSWGDKLRSGRVSKVAVLEKPFAGLPIGTRLYVPSPERVAEAVNELPAGTRLSVKEFRERIARIEKVDAACPTTTAIALRVVAEAAIEELTAGAAAKSVTPFWRAVAPTDPLAAKLSCGLNGLADLQRRE